jgi:uncharacterized protein YjbI with pentapeptide repeats
MQETCTSGTVRGAPGNRRSYRRGADPYGERIMAKQDIEILNQGVTVWNEWREKNPRIRPDLVEAKLSDSKLRDANFSDVDFSGANLTGAELESANLGGANLSHANLKHASLCRAYLSNANFSGANLNDADLTLANLNDVNLSNADLSNARIGWTIFGNNDLRMVSNLDSVRHLGPSIISVSTIRRSEGNIPEVFLRGAGVPDTLITNLRSLISENTELQRPTDGRGLTLIIHGHDDRNPLILKDWLFHKLSLPEPIIM